MYKAKKLMNKKISDAKSAIHSSGWIAQLGRASYHTPECFGFNPQSGHIQEVTSPYFSFTSMFLFLFLFLYKLIKHIIG